MPAIKSPAQILKLWKTAKAKYHQNTKTKEMEGPEEALHKKICTSLHGLARMATAKKQGGKADPEEFASTRDYISLSIKKYGKALAKDKTKPPVARYFQSVNKLNVVVIKLQLGELDDAETDVSEDVLNDVDGDDVERPEPEPAANAAKDDGKPPIGSTPDANATLFEQRLKALAPQVQQAVAGGRPAAVQAQLKLSEGDAFFKNKDYVQANARLDEAEVLLKQALAEPAKPPSPSPTPVPPPQQSPVAKSPSKDPPLSPTSPVAVAMRGAWERRVLELEPGVLEAKKKRPGEAKWMTLFMKAQYLRESEHYVDSFEVLDKLEELLKSPRAKQQEADSIVATQKARLEPSNDTDDGEDREVLPKQSEVRQSKFASAAMALGLTQDAAKALYELSGGSQADPVTGFEDPADRESTLARAIEQTQQPGARPAFTVDVSIRNLGGLNALLGHNEADKVLTMFARIVSKATEGVGGVVSKFRQGGTDLRFIVVGQDVRQSHIEAALMAAQAEVMRQVSILGFDKIEHPKYKLDLSQKGTGVAYDIAPIKPSQSADDSQGAARKSEAPEGVKFKSAAQVRREEFVKKAMEQHGLTQEAALQLYGMSGAAKVDTLTGFDSAADRLVTLQSSMQYIRQSGAKGFYVEIDVRNLGGLTAALGRSRADGAFATMASITDQAVRALAADVSRFRHGGDEISFIVVGDGITEGSLNGALTGAQKAIAEYVKSEKLDAIEHPKYPNDAGKRGTGIVFGISGITGGDGEKTDDILSAADGRVEAAKKQ